MAGTNIVEFKKNLNALVASGDLPLPSTVSVEAFKNAAIVAVQDTKDIEKCSPESVFKSVRILAGMGLIPDGREAALVAYYDTQTKAHKAQAQPMVGGLIKVARNSGQIATMWAEVVYAGETLPVWIEDGVRCWDHTNEDGSRLNAMSRKVGEVIGAYAVAKLKDGTIEFLPMSREEIEKRRRSSQTQWRWVEKGGKRERVFSDEPVGIWGDWYEEMAKKTVIRALTKTLPMSSEDYNRIQLDPSFREIDERDVTPKERPADRLKRMAQEASAPKGEPEIVEGEVLAFSEEDADPFSDAWQDGIDAFQAGTLADGNPHKANPEFSSWMGGWLMAQKNAETDE